MPLSNEDSRILDQIVLSEQKKRDGQDLNPGLVGSIVVSATDSSRLSHAILRDPEGKEIDHSSNGPTPEDEAWAYEVEHIACGD